MNVVEKATLLKKEADRLLKEKGIDAVLRRHGKVYYTGSYELDLLVWKDIDVQIISPSNKVLESFTELFSDLILLEDVIRAKLAKYMTKIHHGKGLPEGLFMGLRVFNGDWKSYWKLDIWALSEDQVAENQKYLAAVRLQLTEEKREKILKMKDLLMTTEGRTPPFSGYHLYQAILFEGLEDEEEIIDYLLNKGVHFDFRP